MKVDTEKEIYYTDVQEVIKTYVKQEGKEKGFGWILIMVTNLYTDYIEGKEVRKDEESRGSGDLGETSRSI